MRSNLASLVLPMESSLVEDKERLRFVLLACPGVEAFDSEHLAHLDLKRGTKLPPLPLRQSKEVRFQPGV